MSKESEQENIKPKVSGGPFFFLSLLCLLVLGGIGFSCLPLLINSTSIRHLGIFFGSAVCGMTIAKYMIRGHISVFLHELKHSIISNFAGNRAKELVVRRDSGHFQYEYTKQSARFNAFISLAPYWVPLFTAPSVGLAYLFWRTSHPTMVAIVGIAFGIDFVLNIRDISPHQSDLALIRGGYRIAIFYILAMNLTTTSILLAWVMQGPAGIGKIIAALLQTLWHLRGLLLHF